MEEYRAIKCSMFAGMGKGDTAIVVEDEIDAVKMLAAGAEVKRTTLTEQFTYEAYREQYSDSFLLLMAINGNVGTVATEESAMEPQPGWTLLSLATNGKAERVPAESEELKVQRDLRGAGQVSLPALLLPSAFIDADLRFVKRSRSHIK